jgi:hypothetical protein
MLWATSAVMPRYKFLLVILPGSPFYVWLVLDMGLSLWGKGRSGQGRVSPSTRGIPDAEASCRPARQSTNPHNQNKPIFRWPALPASYREGNF